MLINVSISYSQPFRRGATVYPHAGTVMVKAIGVPWGWPLMLRKEQQDTLTRLGVQHAWAYEDYGSWVVTND